MISFGKMRPKLIAKIMRIATEPSPRVAPMSSGVLCELLVSWTRPLAILNMSTPGIIETTEANPTAAKSMGQRSDCDRPGQHLQGRGKENAVASDRHACRNHVIPQRHRSASRVHW